MDDELPPSEAARDRRRDRRSTASAKGLMRTGTAKVFKQILDRQAARAEEDDTATRTRKRRRHEEEGEGGNLD